MADEQPKSLEGEHRQRQDGNLPTASDRPGPDRIEVPAELLERLRTYRQDHVLIGWERLDHERRERLIRDLAAIDLDLLARLHAESRRPASGFSRDRLSPLETEHLNRVDCETVRLGHESLARGELAVLLVAGGQGTRLGFDRPKGMFPIGPVSNKTLFEIHADKVFALVRRYGKPIPFLIMTSPATDEDTRAYFREHRYFGLDPAEVFFFRQGTMPAVDMATGRLLLEAPGIVFASPNGHGGVLLALREAGLLAALSRRGIRHLFYFQVDNPLVRVGDPAFLGRHIAVRSEASSKAIAKAYPGEKMGVFARIDGRCAIIEYSDLPDDLAWLMGPDGRLVYGAGSPAIHLFELEFLQRLAEAEEPLPFHIARKKAAYVTPEGERVEPATENALKFEMFIFDALPHAERYLVLEAERSDEFAPVKNATGVDSPATCRAAWTARSAAWLERAGCRVARDGAGQPLAALEISPRFALDETELQARLWPGRVFDQPTYLE